MHVSVNKKLINEIEVSIIITPTPPHTPELGFYNDFEKFFGFLFCTCFLFCLLECQDFLDVAASPSHFKNRCHVHVMESFQLF